MFPEARFVHAVRDGRDVALAHTDGTKIEQVAVSWKRRVGAGRAAGESLGPDRYIESRFEELIEDTEGSVRKLCDFLELSFDPQMLTYYERADDIVSTTAVPDRHKDIFLPPTKGLPRLATGAVRRPGRPIRGAGRRPARRSGLRTEVREDATLRPDSGATSGSRRRRPLHGEASEEGRALSK